MLKAKLEENQTSSNVNSGNVDRTKLRNEEQERQEIRWVNLAKIVDMANILL